MSYQSPYLSPHQSITHPPTDWEMELADVLEGAFSKGAYELDALVEALNASRVRPRGRWRVDRRKVHDDHPRAWSLRP